MIKINGKTPLSILDADTLFFTANLTSTSKTSSGPTLTKEELMTDYGNGQRFIHQYKDQVFYSPEQGNWFIWDGVRCVSFPVK